MGGNDEPVVEDIEMRSRLLLFVAVCALIAPASARAGTTWTVTVKDLAFEPATLVVAPGDTVLWEWVTGEHSVEDANGTICAVRSAPATCSIEVPLDPDPFVVRYHCRVHGPYMSGLVTTNPPPSVRIDSPDNGDVVTSLVEFAGLAGDDTSLTRVRLSWESTPIVLVTGSADATCAGCGTPSATWRVTPLLLPGRYVVRATATDDLGIETTSLPVTVTVV